MMNFRTVILFLKILACFMTQRTFRDLIFPKRPNSCPTKFQFLYEDIVTHKLFQTMLMCVKPKKLRSLLNEQ